jgi:Domain of unknown function (DUF927)
MEPLEFLAEVLPPPGNGYYCVAELTKKKEHVYVETLEEAQPVIDKWNRLGYDIYFGLSTFGKSGSRVAANVHMCKVIAVDVDCNHPKDLPDEQGVIKQKAYPSPKAAAQAIMQFSEETGLAALGNPWLVASGGGVHAYWPLKEATFIDEWKPVAEAFKRLCFQKKLGIDPTVTADAARVLRIPASVNTGVKGKNRVREQTNVTFKNQGDFFDLDDIRAVLERELVGTPYEAKTAPVPTLQLEGKRPTQELSPTTLKLFENSVTKFGIIYKKTKAGEGCGQLRHYIENASDDGMEPLWRGLLSYAQKCDDGEKAALWLSGLHPYDEDRMRTKLSEIKGPYPCTKMDSENPGVCVSCKHWGKITNPLILGRETSVVTQETVIEVEQPRGQKEGVKRPEAPRGYAYGQRGGVFMEKEDEDANGTKVVKQVMLLPYDLFPVDILNTNGEHTIHMLALRPTGVQTVTLPQRAVVTKDETMKQLANQNIIASFGAGNDNNLFGYIRSVVEKMSTEKAPITVPTSYGWQEDDSFVFAGAIYRTGQEPAKVPMAGLENIVMNTQPTGTLEAWGKFINMLVSKGMWDHIAVILASAGSPLMRFTGLHGMTIHCASTESGTGKTLALDGAASIWGHPIHYRTGAGTSPVAMQQRLGLLHSTPLITDEITTKNRDTFEWFPSFLLSMSEGRGKERMESGTNKERLNLSTWSAMAIMSSNTHAVDYMTGARKHSSEGELRRLIEYIMDEKLSWTAEEIEIIKSLQDNYAVAGDALVRYWVNNFATTEALVKQTVRKMYDAYEAPNDERFWMSGIGAAIAAGIMFGSNFANIAEIPLEPIIKSFGKRIAAHRISISGGKRKAEDVLNEYVQEHYGHFVIVHYGEKAGPLAHLGNDAAVDRATTRSEVMGRIEHGVAAGYSDFFIEERLLKAYCSNRSFGYATLKQQLEEQFVVSYQARKDMMAKTNGPAMRVNVIKISRRTEEVDEDRLRALALEQS